MAKDRVERLAHFIMDTFPGEPSRSEGAIETAIRLLSTEVRGETLEVQPDRNDFEVRVGEAVAAVERGADGLVTEFDALVVTVWPRMSGNDYPPGVNLARVRDGKLVEHGSVPHVSAPGETAIVWRGLLR